MSALEIQEGGSHYKDLKIQPVEYIHANGLGFCEGNVVKYITRWRSKGGVEDLKKAKHFIELLIELEQRLPEENKSPVAEAQRFFEFTLAMLPPVAVPKRAYQIGIDGIDRDDIQQLRHSCFAHVLYALNYELSYNQLCQAFFAALRPLEEDTNWPDGVER